MKKLFKTYFFFNETFENENDIFIKNNGFLNIFTSKKQK